MTMQSERINHCSKSRVLDSQVHQCAEAVGRHQTFDIQWSGKVPMSAVGSSNMRLYNAKAATRFLFQDFDGVVVNRLYHPLHEFAPSWFPRSAGMETK